jgi:hypothetical protein
VSAGPDPSPRSVSPEAAAWEERARGAEAELAAVRWELYIVREAWRAVLDRLVELEERPLRRLARRLRRTSSRPRGPRLPR